MEDVVHLQGNRLGHGAFTLQHLLDVGRRRCRVDRRRVGQFVQRAFALFLHAPGLTVTEHVHGGRAAGISSLMGVPLREARESFEREYLKIQIRRLSGNISKTAEFIGMERSALHRKLKLLGLHDR